MKNWQLFLQSGIHAMAMIFLVFQLSIANGEPVNPTTDAAHSTQRGFVQCTPVGPNMEVPWIDVAHLPEFSLVHSYFEGCSDLDYAWTDQSYPNPKYNPERTSAHIARVARFLQGLKDYVATESDDWVVYVNTWLGSTLPPSTMDSRKFANGNAVVWSHSDARGQTMERFQTRSNILGVYGTHTVSSQGVVSMVRQLSISGFEDQSFCITPVDLQTAFVNGPDYLLRPASVRTERRRPDPHELAKLGGQWFGYEVHVFNSPKNGNSAGLIRFGFSFKPCANQVNVELTKTKVLEEKP